MFKFQVGDSVLIPSLRAVAHRTGEIASPYWYTYKEILEEGEIVSLFATDNRPAAVIYNHDLQKRLEYFLDAGIQLDSEDGTG